MATSPPLCLDPDPHITRIINQVVRVSTPSMPPSLKRKSSAMEPEEDGPDKARKERTLGFMAPRDNRSSVPRCDLLPNTNFCAQPNLVTACWTPLKACGPGQRKRPSHPPPNNTSITLMRLIHPLSSHNGPHLQLDRLKHRQTSNLRSLKHLLPSIRRLLAILGPTHPYLHSLLWWGIRCLALCRPLHPCSRLSMPMFKPLRKLQKCRPKLPLTFLLSL